MNIPLRLKPSHTLIAILLFSAVGLYSCGKEADPSVIKVSSTPIEGITPTTPTTGTGGNTGTGTGTGSGTGTGTNLTVNSNGDGGVAIGGSNTIIFTLKGTKYTLTTSNSYTVGGAILTLGNIDATTIFGQPNPLTTGIELSMGIQGAATGVYNLTVGEVILADGTSYNLAKTTPVGKMNFNTFSSGAVAVISKGTFDAILVNDKDATDVQRVSGSFNVQ
jgi:hypothetical protein